MSIKLTPYKFNFSNDIIRSLSNYQCDEDENEELLTPEVTIEKVQFQRRKLCFPESSRASTLEERNPLGYTKVSRHLLLKGYLELQKDSGYDECSFKLFNNMCPLCSYSAPRRDMLRLHLKMNHKEYKPYACNLCPYSSLERKMLTRHFLSVHQRYKPHKCPECDYCASLNSNLKKHVENVHRKNKPHKCGQCPYNTSEKGKLRRHVESVHLNIKPFICTLCCFSTNRECTLKAHISTIHHRQTNLYSCGECPYKAGEKYELKNHFITSHLSFQTIKCRKCCYYFSSKEVLSDHNLISHSYRRPKVFECGDCLKVYKDKRSLKIHVLSVHLKEKPFRCNYCSYRTVAMRYVRKHIASNHKI